MKKLNLFYDPINEQYFVLYRSSGVDMLFKVDQVQPTMLSRIIEVAWFKSKDERSKVIQEMEEFVKKEIENLNQY